MKTALIIALLASTPALAGDLNPPPGPVAETMKTLDEVEPRTAINDENTPGDGDSRFRISQPGSYYLTDEATHGNGQRGIEIASSNVTVDLNGFTIRSTQTGTLEAIGFVGAVGDSVTVRNGTIQDSDRGGVLLAIVSQASVEGVNIRNVGGNGIDLGAAGEARGCEVRETGGIGIRVQNGRIERCSADRATQIGFLLSSSGVITDCQAFGFEGSGFQVGSDVVLERCHATSVTDGFRATGSGNTFRDCNASFCFADGFTVDGPCLLIGCTARQNATFGIDCFDAVGCRIESCIAEGNGVVGITGGDGSTIEGCSAFGNGSNAQHSGIRLAGQGTIIGCTSSNNTGQGIEIPDVLDGNALIADCVVDNNTGDGIVANQGSVVRGCSATRNGVRGIRGIFGVSITQCSASENGDAGISASAGSTISECTSRSNGSNGFSGTSLTMTNCSAASNAQSGFASSGTSLIQGCTSVGNTLAGFNVTSKAVIRECQARFNLSHGIVLFDGATAERNICASNELDGIRASSGGCVVDGNTVIENGENGIRIFASSCLIIRNRAQGNTLSEYNINAGNDVGIIQTSPVGAGPWDNFEF